MDFPKNIRKMPSMTKHIDTIAVHAGREDFQELGVHAAPLDFSSTYPVKDLEFRS